VNPNRGTCKGVRCGVCGGRLHRGLRTPSHRHGFALIELLVVIGIIGVLISLVVPALSRARTQGKTTVCKSRLRNIGAGLAIYANENDDLLVPGRMPKVNSEEWAIGIEGGVKYRPTFLAMLGTQVGLRPFEDPQRRKSDVDRFDQPGDRQNYSSPVYVCPERADWVDERNGAYGYNYQFLGNARLGDSSNIRSYKNWPIRFSKVKSPVECVVVGDSAGTAASFDSYRRLDYEDNLPRDSASGRTVRAWGNEGFNLDPPRVDPEAGEMADLDGDEPSRAAVHERHAKKAVVLWLDGHATDQTAESLGYKLDEKKCVLFDGNNRFFHIKNRDEAWVDR